MIKPFRIVDATVDLTDESLREFESAGNARVTIVFGRKLNSFEQRRVRSEVENRVSDDVRVNVSNTKAVIETREFEAVKSFIEAANSYSQEWTEDAGRELERVKTELESVQDGLKSLVRWQKPQQQFL